MSSSNILRLLRDALTLNGERLDLISGDVLKVRPLADDTGSVNIGDGTYDMDVKVFLGTTGEYVLFDVGNSQLDLQCPLALTGDLTVAGVTTFTDTVVTAEHGAGFISTAFAPLTSRRTVNGTIITEIKFDMDGLAVQGTTGKDVIGLDAAASSYIGKYVVATYGVVYRIEMICTVLPTQQTATIALDLDLGADTVNRAQNATADDVVIDAGVVAAGNVYVTNVPALTDGDYLYLIEGAGLDGATGEYSGGQFIIRFYGHPLLT